MVAIEIDEDLRRVAQIAIVLASGVFTGRVSGAQEDAWARAPAIVATANAWREGEPIPADLQIYRQSPRDMPIPRDSEVLIDGITNVPLLGAHDRS